MTEVFRCRCGLVDLPVVPSYRHHYVSHVRRVSFKLAPDGILICRSTHGLLNVELHRKIWEDDSLWDEIVGPRKRPVVLTAEGRAHLEELRERYRFTTPEDYGCHCPIGTRIDNCQKDRIEEEERDERT